MLEISEILKKISDNIEKGLIQIIEVSYRTGAKQGVLIFGNKKEKLIQIFLDEKKFEFTSYWYTISEPYFEIKTSINSPLIVCQNSICFGNYHNGFIKNYTLHYNGNLCGLLRNFISEERRKCAVWFE